MKFLITTDYSIMNDDKMLCTNKSPNKYPIIKAGSHNIQTRLFNSASNLTQFKISMKIPNIYTTYERVCEPNIKLSEM